jgi:CheY-like chemotaxis protein
LHYRVLSGKGKIAMNSGEFHRYHDDAKGNSEPARKKCAWIICGAFDAWWAIALELHRHGIEAKIQDYDSDLREIVTQADREGGVIVIDLTKDPARGLGIMRSCHGYSESVPLIPIVAEPTLDLTQRLRDLHAFCLAVPPLDEARIRAMFEAAFRYVERKRLAAATKRKKILVIDDDRDYCRSVQALLEKEGHEVFCARSGFQGLEMAISIVPDLIVLDVMMENTWAGYEVSQTLKFRSGYESVARIPIVMVSSIEEHPAERFARSGDPAMVGPDIYFTKPLDIKRFVDTVRLLLKMESAAKVQDA